MIAICVCIVIADSLCMSAKHIRLAVQSFSSSGVTASGTLSACFLLPCSRLISLMQRYLSTWAAMCALYL